MGRLDDETVLVTGASRGLGKSMAQRFAREGANTVFSARSENDLMKAASEADGETLAVPADVTDEAAVEALIETAVDEYGELTGLVNNAAVGLLSLYDERRHISEIDADDWRFIMEVNVTGPFLCSKHAIPHLAESDQGRIINISSQGSKRASGTNTAYCVSKAGISHLTRSLAAELGSEGVNVNGIMPGPVRTEMMVDVLDDPEQRQTYLDQMCVDFYGVPEDIGRVAVFLASEDSRYVTGHEVAAEGGWLVN